MTALAAAAPLAVHRSRKLIPDFRLHRPANAAEAVAMKAAAGPGAVYMAGGIDVVNGMKSGLQVTDLIYLGAVTGLDGIEDENGWLRLGALLTHDRLPTAPLVRARLPALAQTWSDAANIRIRCKGTVGGNIMARDPGYDFALAVLAADARLHFLAGDGTRTISAGQLNAGMPDGLLTAVSMPPSDSFRFVFDRSLRPIATLALGLDIGGGYIIGGRVAIGCAYSMPLAVSLPLNETLSPGGVARSAEPLARDVTGRLPAPLSDHNATSDYRRRMIEVLIRRNLSAVA